MVNVHRLSTAVGLGPDEVLMLEELEKVYDYHYGKNKTKDRYYNGNVTLGEVNLGIALPDGFRGLEIGCEWGAKAVDVLAARSMFDGFVGENGQNVETMRVIFESNNLRHEYDKACRDELKYGCAFATLSADPECGCKIRFHSPMTAAALWDGEHGRIKCGFAIIDTVEDESQVGLWHPSIVNLYTDEAIWVLRRDGDKFFAECYPHKMGRPLMEPLTWNATNQKPFGRSRLKKPIRELIKGYVRTVANATIGLEFSTAPQKYLLGLTDEQYDTIINSKFRQYIGNIIAATINPETGEKPSFGQLSQGNISPHVDMIRLLATQFSAATGLTVTDVGIINDANPTSSDAILAQSQTLVSMAEQLNAGNGDSLRNIALMAQAIARNVGLDGLTDEEKSVIAHFKNPAMPSVSVTADAAIKIASARQAFAQTDTFLEMIGFDQADIRRIKAQEARSRGLALFDSLEVNADDNTSEGMV